VSWNGKDICLGYRRRDCICVAHCHATNFIWLYLDDGNEVIVGVRKGGKMG
jgi:hypothetical protein